MANAKSNPDRVFAVGVSGVWRSENFGKSWDLTPIDAQWSFTNRMDIEVSEADTDIIWAGGAMTNGRRIFVSTDGGTSFSPTSVYPNEELGTVSGLGAHPDEPETGYALFSFARRPKVLRTRDLGQTWEDISGFETGGDVSDRGPRAKVHSDGASACRSLQVTLCCANSIQRDQEACNPPFRN